jgi:hypothetical protein
MGSVYWITDFLDRHRARYAPPDWPANRDEMREWLRGWVLALDRIQAVEQEADDASLALVLAPPQWRREHIPAVIGAIAAARRVAAERRLAALAVPGAERARRLAAMAARFPNLARWEGFLASACMDELAGEPVPPPDPGYVPPEPAPRPGPTPVRLRPTIPHLDHVAPVIYERDGRLVRVGPAEPEAAKSPESPEPEGAPDAPGLPPPPGGPGDGEGRQANGEPRQCDPGQGDGCLDVPG